MWAKMERETGFEPATLGMGGRCSTPELLPHALNYTLDTVIKCIRRMRQHIVRTAPADEYFGNAEIVYALVHPTLL
jgi:hypothetical protein